jgi:ribosomal protein uL23
MCAEKTQEKSVEQKPAEEKPVEKTRKPRAAKTEKAPNTEKKVTPKAAEKTQAKAEKPKKEKPKAVEGYNPWNVLSHPHLTEKSMNLVERGNVLVFIVSKKATKGQIKEAVEKGFGAPVVSVRVQITRKNEKKAYVRIAEGTVASDIATRLGMI